MTQELLPLIMDAALAGLLVQHRQAQMCSYLLYFEQGLTENSGRCRLLPFWPAQGTCHLCIGDVHMQAPALETLGSDSSWPPASLHLLFLQTVLVACHDAQGAEPCPNHSSMLAKLPAC